MWEELIEIQWAAGCLLDSHWVRISVGLGCLLDAYSVRIQISIWHFCKIIKRNRKEKVCSWLKISTIIQRIRKMSWIPTIWFYTYIDCQVPRTALYQNVLAHITGTRLHSCDSLFLKLRAKFDHVIDFKEGIRTGKSSRCCTLNRKCELSRRNIQMKKWEECEGSARRKTLLESNFTKWHTYVRRSRTLKSKLGSRQLTLSKSNEMSQVISLCDVLLLVYK